MVEPDDIRGQSVQTTSSQWSHNSSEPHRPVTSSELQTEDVNKSADSSLHKLTNKDSFDRIKLLKSFHMLLGHSESINWLWSTFMWSVYDDIQFQFSPKHNIQRLNRWKKLDPLWLNTPLHKGCDGGTACFSYCYRLKMKECEGISGSVRKHFLDCFSCLFVLLRFSCECCCSAVRPHRCVGRPGGWGWVLLWWRGLLGEGSSRWCGGPSRSWSWGVQRHTALRDVRKLGEKSCRRSWTSGESSFSNSTDDLQLHVNT